jgi:hypothetical protein
MLVTLPRATDEDWAIDALEAARCPDCRDFAVLRIRRTRHDSDGKKAVTERLSPTVVPGADLDLLAGLVREQEVGAPASGSRGTT